MTMTLLAMLLLGGVATDLHGDDGVLRLADRGTTDYRIIVSRNPEYGEDLAAKELAHFPFGMTKAEFPFEYDTESAIETEIIIGNTRRKRLEDIPEHLRTDNWEGFPLLREGKKLYIMRNIPRATLYGVYDFLDVELGVRFLTERVNHLLDRSQLEVTMASRKYGLPIERRTICARRVAVSWKWPGPPASATSARATPHPTSRRARCTIRRSSTS